MSDWGSYGCSSDLGNCATGATGRSATRCTMRARNRQAREGPALPPRRLRGGRRTADARGDQLVHAAAPCKNGARFRSRKVSRACSYPPGHARRRPMSQRLDYLDLPADDVRALGGKLLDLAAQWLAGEPQVPDI